MATFHREFWNQRFTSEDYVYGVEPAGFLREHVHTLPQAARVFVPADGEGRNSVFLAGLGHSVVATDIADAGITKARQLARSHDVAVDFQCLDLEGWAWPEAAFDAVVAIFIQFAGPELRDEVFAGMKHAIRPGGRLLLHGYTTDQLALGTGGPPRLENLYTEEILREAFGDWEIERLEAYERELQEGVGHHGRSALIDLIARRPTD